MGNMTNAGCELEQFYMMPLYLHSLKNEWGWNSFGIKDVLKAFKNEGFKKYAFQFST